MSQGGDTEENGMYSESKTGRKLTFIKQLKRRVLKARVVPPRVGMYRNAITGAYKETEKKVIEAEHNRIKNIRKVTCEDRREMACTLATDRRETYRKIIAIGSTLTCARPLK